jgi:hypothetical protein
MLGLADVHSCLLVRTYAEGPSDIRWRTIGHTLLSFSANVRGGPLDVH